MAYQAENKLTDQPTSLGEDKIQAKANSSNLHGKEISLDFQELRYAVSWQLGIFRR